MSRLLDLLNPAPNSNSEAPPAVPSPIVSTTGARYNYHNRHPSITSPLEALAIAATGSPPALSPANSTNPSFASNSHHGVATSSASRPDHFPLPTPQSAVQSRQPLSPTLDHPHSFHPGQAPKLSEIARETPQELPPLRSMMSDENDTSMAEPAVTPNASSREAHPHSNIAEKSQPRSSMPESHNSTQRFGSTISAKTEIPHQSYAPVPSNPTESTGRKIHDPNAKDEKTNTNGMEYHPASGVGPFQGLARAVPQVDGTDEELTSHDRASTPMAGVAMKRENSTTSQPADTKKRPAPKPDKKKGIASVIKRPPVKKRKVENESKDATPFSQRSGTPASSRASKTPGPKVHQRNSGAMMNSSPAPGSRADTQDDDDDDDMDDDTTIFCICRKPDDHTWMIGCDGGCEDWFHGRCVNMNERDGNLIDKYICPNCVEAGIGQTTWKPMCRLETCREPARVTGAARSKYCCDDHGVLYMKQRSLGRDSKSGDPSKAALARKRRKENYTDNAGNGDDMEDIQPGEEDGDDQAYLRGGVLRAGELKSLAGGVKDLEEFKKLGEGVLSPPRTLSPENKGGHQADGEGSNQTKAGKAHVVYTTEESSQLAEIHAKKSTLKRKREALDDKEKLFGLVKARMKVVLEALKKDGVKDICGFDARLSWSDEEFDNWRASGEGQKALAKGGVLGAPQVANTANSRDGDEKMVNGHEEEEVGKGVCQKKRCERHKAWTKLHLTEINFEREECRMEMVKLDREEKGVEERAMLRFLESGNDVVDEEQGDASDPGVAMSGITTAMTD